MPIVEFLCGCRTGNIETRENLLTMDSVAIDVEGMLICAIHGLRRRGWRAIGYSALTPTQLEGRQIFKDAFIELRPLSINFTTADHRDNRDPQSVYMNLVSVGEQEKRRKAAISNGKVTPKDGLELLKRNRE